MVVNIWDSILFNSFQKKKAIEIARPIKKNHFSRSRAILISPPSALFFAAFGEQDHPFGFELGASAVAAKGGLGKNPVHVVFRTVDQFPLQDVSHHFPAIISGMKVTQDHPSSGAQPVIGPIQ